MLKKNSSITLDKFIDYCLYDKKIGYYTTKNPFGKTGDFVTAPNISRLFPEMLAVWTISFWESIGRPKKFNLIELGAGNGEMMKIMIESFKKFPSFLNCCNFFIHEKSQKLISEQSIKIQYKKIKWIQNFKNLNKFPNIFLANEFFDALPIKQFIKKDKKWYEKLVKISNQNNINFKNKKINIEKLKKNLFFDISSNQNFIEFSPSGIRYLKKIAKIINKTKGGLLIVDYGYNGKKFKNTLKAIYNKKHSNVLKNLGKSDITHNINFYLFKKIIKSFVNLNYNYTSQKKFLSNLGIFERAEIISRNKKFTEKADIFYRLKRLTDKNQMGDLFKVLLIKNSFIRSQVGFKN